MNFTPFHWGEYASATLHLTFVQHGIYFQLLRHYYTSETPLPRDVDDVARLAMCGRDYDGDVAYVLRQFFHLEDDGWHQKRADREIAAYRDRHEVAQANGRRGRAKQLATPGGGPGEAGLTKNQEPVTKNHITSARKRASSPEEIWLFSTGAESVMKASNLPERQVKSLIGRWRKDIKDEQLIDVIQASHDKSDVVQWITAAVKQRSKPEESGTMTSYAGGFN